MGETAMKRAGDLIDAIAARENLLLAFWKAQRGKRAAVEVLRFRENLEGELASLRRDLLVGPFLPGRAHVFTIHDPKERVICAAPFRDRVAHHALMNICHDTFESYQIHDSYACRVGKGTHRAVARARYFAARFHYCLKLDVRRFFDSVDHEVLLALLRRRFKDRRVLEIFDAIVRGYETAPGKGVPIGNLTSQYFANHYLGVLDHFVKERLRCRGHVRYMDDFLLFHDEPARLRAWRREVSDYLGGELRLTLKPPCLAPMQRGVTFLGFRVFPNRVTLSRRSRLRFHRKLAAAQERLASGEWDEGDAARHVEPLLAFARHGASEGMRRRSMDRFQDVLHRPRTGSSGAATGTTTPGTAARRIATTTTRRTGTTT